MTKAELDKYKQILEAKKAELAHTLGNREGIAIDASPDPTDESQLACTRQLTIHNLDRESGLFREVKLALSRIEDGSYGTCLKCDEEINPKRLAAVPWALHCISCQESADQSQTEGDDHEVFGDALATA